MQHFAQIGGPIDEILKNTKCDSRHSGMCTASITRRGLVPSTIYTSPRATISAPILSSDDPQGIMSRQSVTRSKRLWQLIGKSGVFNQSFLEPGIFGPQTRQNSLKHPGYLMGHGNVLGAGQFQRVRK